MTIEELRKKLAALRENQLSPYAPVREWTGGGSPLALHFGRYSGQHVRVLGKDVPYLRWMMSTPNVVRRLRQKPQLYSFVLKLALKERIAEGVRLELQLVRDTIRAYYDEGAPEEFDFLGLRRYGARYKDPNDRIRKIRSVLEAPPETMLQERETYQVKARRTLRRLRAL